MGQPKWAAHINSHISLVYEVVNLYHLLGMRLHVSYDCPRSPLILSELYEVENSKVVGGAANAIVENGEIIVSELILVPGSN